jgi:hypothetical protein
VAGWQLEQGRSPTGLTPGATVARSGFDTAIPVGAGSASAFVAVRAVAASGAVLATSSVVALKQPS